MMRTVFVVAVLALLAPMSHAQTALPDSENGRFTFHQVQDGVLRLDSRTGQEVLELIDSLNAQGKTIVLIQRGSIGPPGAYAIVVKSVYRAV